MKDLNAADFLPLLSGVLIVFGIVLIASGADRLIIYTLFVAAAVLPIVSYVVRRGRR